MPRKDFKGENNPKWNDGKCTHWSGYILIASPGHPYAENRGYVREHRLVMEKHIGRYLLPKEDIHHLNEDKTDNRIENLVLFKNRSEHIKMFHSNVGIETRFKKGHVSANKNGKFVKCAECDKMFWKTKLSTQMRCSRECANRLLSRRWEDKRNIIRSKNV